MQTTDHVIHAPQRRSDARPGADVNETGLWEVRIEWWHAPEVTWPRFSYAQAQTQQQAEVEAGRAITYGDLSGDLCAIATSVRAPSGTEWNEVARRRLRAAAEGAESATLDPVVLEADRY